MLPSPPCPNRSHFSLEVKLNSSGGLLFYVAGERGTFMALLVSNGRFVFLLEVGGRRLRIRSKDKYRDRRWHTVSGGLGLGGAPVSHPPSPRGRLGTSLPDTRGPRERRGQRKRSRGWLKLRAALCLPWLRPRGRSQPRNPPALALTFAPCRSSSAETRAEPSWSLTGCEPRTLPWPPRGSSWLGPPCMSGESRLEKPRLTYR